MKTLEQIRETIRQNQDSLVERYGVKVVAIFGSYACSRQRQDSDIDMLIEILHPVSIFEIIGAEIYLSELLGSKVDLIPKHDVRPELRDSIFKEAIAI